MPSFGEQLRQARESQSITLQEIAATTKISSRALQALESEQFDQLPGGIFNKGFVRAYARYVGLDEEKMLAAYRAAAKDNTDSETDMQTVSDQIVATRKPAKESRIGGTTLMSVLAVIVGLALGGLWFREHRREVREQAALQAAQPPAPVAAAPPTAPVAPPQASGSASEATPPDASAIQGTAPATPGQTAPAAAATGTAANSNAAPNAASIPAPTAASNAASNTTPGALPSAATSNAPPKANLSVPSNTTPNATSVPSANVPGAMVAKNAATSAGQAAPVEVSFSATQKAWISVTSDGKKLESLTLDPDDPNLRSRSYKAQEKLKVVVGNAGGVTAVCNGKPAGPLGPEGQPKTITFTPQGIVGR